MKDTICNFRMNGTVDLLVDLDKMEREAEKDQTKMNAYRRKLGEGIGRPLLETLLEPYFSISSVRSLDRNLERETGRNFLRLTDEFGLGEFTALYEKALNLAEEKSGQRRSIDRVQATLNIFSPPDTEVGSSAILRITFVRSAGNDVSSGFVVDVVHTYEYALMVAHSDKTIECAQMPDIEERSIASPVYLVNSQNVKNTFGHTVKENPLGIYLCARRYGWSEVTFHGQQVLLKADIHIR